jgi:hypothetical protein
MDALITVIIEAVKSGVGDLLVGVVRFVPYLLAALAVFVIGWLFSVGAGRLVSEILKRLNFNQIFERGGLKQAIEKADLKIDPAGFVGGVVKWILVIISLFIAVDILGFEQFANFLTDVVAYLPNVFVAALIMVVAIIIADIAERIVRAAVEGVSVGHGHLIGTVVRWFIWIFAIFSALLQLQIAVVPIETLLTSIFQNVGLGLAAAFALAFGLGGKDQAADIIRELRSKL